MKGARWIVISTIVTATMSLGASNAFAATEVGSRCEANSSVIAGLEGILFPLSSGTPGALPTSVPTPGIATQWTARTQGSDSFLERLKVLRLASEAEKIAIVAESPREEVSKGHGTFSIRIPVQVGDRFGLNGPLGALACSPVAPGEIAGLTAANGSPGSTEHFSEYAGGQPAVSVVVEPDADGDGYGDETQDKCPQSAAYQGECPTIALDAFPVALKRSVLVLVSASTESSVHVFGQVTPGRLLVPRGASVSKKTGPRTRKPKKQKPISFVVGLDGGTQTVAPGQVARFNVKLPTSVKRRLGRISPGESLTASITASTSDLAGRMSTKVLNVRLPGQDRPG